MENAARHLTPITLELGGKSPCLIFGDVDLDLAAKRIVWGKFFNNGQTCVSPDYVIIQKGFKIELITKMKKYINLFYTENPQNSSDYGRIINYSHFKRLQSLYTREQILLGGHADEKDLYISPTVLQVDDDSTIMQDEIFGPLLPILEKKNLNEGLKYVLAKDKPLATYLFTKDKCIQEKVIATISTGGMCINDTIIHISTNFLPFGGVGMSGMGRYHGKFSFECFSYKKSVMKRSFLLDFNLRYPPYGGKLWLIKRFLRWFG